MNFDSSDYDRARELAQGSGPVSEKQYTLHLVEPQLRILSRALECLSRLQSGQIEYAVEAGTDRMLAPDTDTQTVRDMCEGLKAVLYPELSRNQSYGVGARDRPLVGEAYTIKEVIDQALDGRDRGSMRWGIWPRPEVRELAGQTVYVNEERIGAWDRALEENV